jgi:DNA repair protein RecN (Recombination protein N)
VSLRRLELRDFVIVRELALDLQRGFTVLTGETGAGKSILIDALQIQRQFAHDHKVAQLQAPEAHALPRFQCSFSRSVSK